MNTLDKKIQSISKLGIDVTRLGDKGLDGGRWVGYVTKKYNGLDKEDRYSVSIRRYFFLDVPLKNIQTKEDLLQLKSAETLLKKLEKEWLDYVKKQDLKKYYAETE